MFCPVISCRFSGAERAAEVRSVPDQSMVCNDEVLALAAADAGPALMYKHKSPQLRFSCGLFCGHVRRGAAERVRLGTGGG